MNDEINDKLNDIIMSDFEIKLDRIHDDDARLATIEAKLDRIEQILNELLGTNIN